MTVAERYSSDTCGQGADGVAERLDRVLGELETGANSFTAGLTDRVNRLLAVARSRGLHHVEGRGRLVLADLGSRERNLVLDEGRVAREVLAEAVRVGDDLLAARAQACLATVFRLTGLLVESFEAAQESVRLLPPDAPPHLCLDHAVRLAVIVGEHLPGTGYRGEFERLIGLARDLGNPHLLLVVLNNAAWVEHVHDRTEEALALVAELERTAAASGIRLNTAALDTVAGVAMAAGDLPRAERAARAMVAPDAVNTEPGATAMAAVRLSEVLYRLGRTHDALESVRLGLVLSDRDDLQDAYARALRHQAALFADLGRYRAAYETLDRFLAVEASVRSKAADARAAVIRETADAAETERRGAAFASLAARDPLTGLRNRRGLDGDLATMVDVHRRSGAPLAACYVDLDRFKSVNDTWSHATGDAVLGAVADVLDGALPVGSVVARLGGEEFVALLPGHDADGAVRVCRDLRAELTALDWPRLVPDRRITASFGIAELGGEVVDGPDLTRAADAQLYRAKRAGRDRIAWPGGMLGGDAGTPDAELAAAGTAGTRPPGDRRTRIR